ncbi:MAG: hypothetical protein K2X87_18470 [Gemmataceae bacterium]|nr:hypothetical protein [Gemmataceae bacterium]
MPQRRPWLVVGVVFAAGAATAFWFGWYVPAREHRDWYDRVCADIRALEHNRPPDIDPPTWEYVISWAVNLHANCAGYHTWVEPDWLDGFAAELERRLDGPVTLADIHWIWDEYAAHTKGGAS